jgi:broad specificity phosphatase PhoE
MRGATLAVFLAALPAAAHSAIFIVRHAERLDAKDDASLISQAGKRRAVELRRVLSSVELSAVYCTEYKRTQQTAAPAAEARKFKPVIVSSERGPELARTLRALPATEDVLVVGHTDTIPDLLKALGVDRTVMIGSGDYDNLFIVSPQEGKAPAFQWLHFGGSSVSPK